MGLAPEAAPGEQPSGNCNVCGRNTSIILPSALSVKNTSGDNLERKTPDHDYLGDSHFLSPFLKLIT